MEPQNKENEPVQETHTEDVGVSPEILDALNRYTAEYQNIYPPEAFLHRLSEGQEACRLLLALLVEQKRTNELLEAILKK